MNNCDHFIGTLTFYFLQIDRVELGLFSVFNSWQNTDEDFPHNGCVGSFPSAILPLTSVTSHLARWRQGQKLVRSRRWLCVCVCGSRVDLTHLYASHSQWIGLGRRDVANHVKLLVGACNNDRNWNFNNRPQRCCSETTQLCGIYHFKRCWKLSGRSSLDQSATLPFQDEKCRRLSHSLLLHNAVVCKKLLNATKDCCCWPKTNYLKSKWNNVTWPPTQNQYSYSCKLLVLIDFILRSLPYTCHMWPSLMILSYCSDL